MNEHLLKIAIENSDTFKRFEKFKQGLTVRKSNIKRLLNLYQQANKFGLLYVKQNKNFTVTDVALITEIMAL